eukprot:scaffold197799_cov17-Prasinocladus_malaysianus.AAC.1
MILANSSSMVSAVSSADGVGRLVMGFFPFLEPDSPWCSPPARQDKDLGKPLPTGMHGVELWCSPLGCTELS